MEHYKDLPDEEIARKVQAGESQMFGILVERYQKKLLRYGNKFLSTTEDIEDIVQDVFVSAYQNIKSFDTEQKFSPWVYRIAHNAYVNALKKKQRNPLVFFDFDVIIPHAVYEDPLDIERERKEMRVLIDKGMESLSPKYKEVLILHFLDDLSYKEISDILHVPVGTVGIRLKRAKEALKESYKKIDTQYGK